MEATCVLYAYVCKWLGLILDPTGLLKVDKYPDAECITAHQGGDTYTTPKEKRSLRL